MKHIWLAESGLGRCLQQKQSVIELMGSQFGNIKHSNLNRPTKIVSCAPGFTQGCQPKSQIVISVVK